MHTQNWHGIGFTADHVDLAASVAGFTERRITADTVRSAVESPDHMPAFWPDLSALGLLGLHVDEHFGGQGGGLVELAIALEVLGRTCAPGPLIPTVLAAAVLSTSQSKASDALLPGLADGSIVGSVGLTDGLTGEFDDTGTLLVTGTTPVLGAILADIVVTSVTVADSASWVVLDRAGLTVRGTASVDVVRGMSVITADELAVSPERILQDVDDATVGTLAGIVLGAEAVGVASWCVSTAAEYAKVRTQFGRPIGQFQAVKHKCAQAAVALEQARAAVWDAARAVDARDPSAEAASAVARLVAPDAAVSAARDCMQVLGGIGYTWEHDAHLFYRRAITLRALLGRSRDCAAAIAEATLSGHSRAVDYELPADSAAIRQQVREELEQIALLDTDEQMTRLGDDGWVMPFLAAPLGRGAGPVEQVVIAEEVQRCGLVVQELGLAAWLMPSIAAHGTTEQRERLVAPTLRGELLWCQMFSEPEAGSDLAALRTEAVKVDGGWRVTGQKVWTSLGSIAEWGVLLARTDSRVPKHQGITYFVVDMQSEGITVRPLREASGSSLFSEVFFSNVFIPDSGVVGDVGNGWEVARGTLGNERVALGKGIALNAGLADLLGFVRRRGVKNVPLDTVGELIASYLTMTQLQTRTLLAQLQGVDSGSAPNVSKYLSMRFGQQVADFCHGELGAAGAYEEADPLSRRWIDLTVSSRAITVYGGTTEVQLNVIGERVLGLPREPEPTPSRA